MTEQTDGNQQEGKNLCSRRPGVGMAWQHGMQYLTSEDELLVAIVGIQERRGADAPSTVHRVTTGVPAQAILAVNTRETIKTRIRDVAAIEIEALSGRIESLGARSGVVKRYAEIVLGSGVCVAASIA